MKKKYLINTGIALTFLYAGISALTHPYDWIGFVPNFVKILPVGKPTVLMAHSIFEMLLAIWILSNKWVKWAGLIAALDILSIVILNGLGALPITFRDIGLVFMAIYLGVANE